VDLFGLGQNPAQSPSGIPAPVGAKAGLIEPSPGVLMGPESPTWISIHGQTTFVDGIHDHFPAAYTGPNSLLQVEPSAMSETATLYIDTRVWEGGELIFNPEIAGGRGFSGVDGIAGFPNGEITRVGKPQPTPYVARLLIRQVWGLGGEKETVVDGPNQLAEERDIDRITVLAGKMTFTDIIDNNKYAHDPRTDLMNWSMIYNGAWDFPADVRGYSYGMAVDFNHKYWAVRWAIFGEPAYANGPNIDDHVLKANGQALEFERRWTWNGHPGAIRTMGYLNLANMGSYRDALADSPIDPNVIATRAWRIKYGFGGNMEQEIAKDIGFWARLGWNDGHTETWAFTPIDQTLAFGFQIEGTYWHRPDDELGIGFAMNGLSAAHREYLEAGGLDFSIGDGKLNYSLEEILETYYNVQLTKNVTFSGDFQFINNPAYNQDRGPVYVGLARLHFDF